MLGTYNVKKDHPPVGGEQNHLQRELGELRGYRERGGGEIQGLGTVIHRLGVFSNK